ncbi:hypothetical protein R69927_03455 [Paraburkholderia domus]|jgi:Rhs family protein|uniref:DUF6531 domain-containing protein n=1 Tax=Paraburkholderia domus TaxID=2793075 RepID=A0A9N8MZ78_9BURK|nr:hypothetical protein R69749_03369 [Paraburkholderia domus]CAE6868675.1 hypothetical protein R75471_00766 [Paraburkholderia domus]CAE6871761.1 hypothetical protein R69927_03455 [Paraburkholderia domus]CAE6878228.1 hypothetical protein R70199_02344 [Paraburkholderia domus]CAE6927783.1 hypothetical protein R70211_04897 [Paraburkholderia domus]
MKYKKSFHGPAAMLVRIATVFACVLTSVQVSADGGDSICLGLYGKSGATPGTPACVSTVTSNTPTGMGSYNCPNNRPLVESWCGSPSPVDPDKNCAAADPVLPANGVTTISETDFVSGDDTPLKFTRSYRSSPFVRTGAGIGVGWFHNWQRQLGLANLSGSSPQVSAYRPDGSRVIFAKAGGAWRSVDGSFLSLTQQSSSWTLKDLLTDASETYSAQGLLQSVSTRTNITTSLVYSDSSTPSSVAPSPGLLISIRQHAALSNPNIDLTILLAYDSHLRIAQMTDPTGAVTQYGYDTHNNLVSVALPDGNVRRYVYDDKRFLAVLTGIIDESGSRVATWTYDAQGRVTAVSHPDTTRNVQLDYGSGSTTLTDSKGFTFLASSLIAGMQRPTVINSTLGNGAVTWDASGRLMTQTSGNGDGATYTYDDSGRPTKSVMTTASGIAVTSIRYADATSLLPSLIASPGWMRSYVYDSNGNVTGISELSTDDSTGVRGFDASTAGGQQRTYGMTYDSTNLLQFAQMYENGVKTGEWFYTVDGYGSLRQSMDRTKGTVQRTAVRDKAHRAIVIDGPGFSANPAYDSRGRVSTFWYSEQASSPNENVARLLKVSYTYAPSGDVASRTATVSTNLGPDVAISSDEIDTWLGNYERGIAPAGPPPNHFGALKKALGVTYQIEPVCALCYLRAADPIAQRLYYNDTNGGDPSDSGSEPKLSTTPRSILAATKCADSCASEKAACRTLCSSARYDPDMRNIWGGSMRRCMMGCVPARCGGNPVSGG